MEFNAKIRNSNIQVKRGPSHIIFVSQDPMNIKVRVHDSGQLQYSTDLINWTNIAHNETTTSSRVIYFRGKMDSPKLFNSPGGAWAFTNASNLRVIGNLNTLLDYENPPTSLLDNCYCQMFKSCTSLTDISELELPATTLATQCYFEMFANCPSLREISPGLLPATTLAESCYSNMFANCPSLREISPGLLPATTLAESCYSNMFNLCTSLTTIPSGFLPAINLANMCYAHMFWNCTSLTTIPSDLLPATILPDSCYLGMFRHDDNRFPEINLIMRVTSSEGYSRPFRIPASEHSVSAASNSLQNFCKVIQANELIQGNFELDTIYYTKDY